MFVTVFYAIYNIRTGELEFSNGGHNSPYILRANGNVEQLPVSTNCIVGAISDVEFSNDKTSLGVGDTLILYTDGVNEATNADNQEYGDDRMERLLGTLAGKSCQDIINAQREDVKNFVGDAPQSDDITLMTIKRKA
jgi:sigma-B regulation protein RsbU (phosphoserine phosphatase)